MDELPCNPQNRKEYYLAKLAGDSVTVPACPSNRVEVYLAGAIDRLDGIEQDIEDMKNNPDVVDVVATYADLQSYDTSTLTDKDVIRVLSDETHDGASTFYRWSAETSSFTYIGEAGGGGAALPTVVNHTLTFGGQ